MTQIRKGNGGTVLLTVSGNQIRKGSGGTTLYTNSGNLSNAELGAVLYALGEIPNSGSKSFGKKGCFIATATMGNYGHPTVIKLSKFRDEYLVNYNWGRKFIRTYNTLSPYPAKIISKSYILKKVCYFTIIKPLLLIATFIMKSKL